MKRTLIAAVCLLFAVPLAQAQLVDFTSIDVQTETKKVKIIENIDKTLRPKGFIFGVGAGMECVPILIEPRYYVDYPSELSGLSVLPEIRAELGYQMTPQFALTGEFFYGGGKSPFALEMYGADRIGGQLIATYYFSPKIDKGLYISGAIGGEDLWMFDDYDTKDDGSRYTWYDYSCWNSSPLFGELGVGYAWKYLKVQAHVDVKSLRYQYSYEKGYGKSHWDRDRTVNSQEDIDRTCLDPCFGLKASFYFNTGYRKFKKQL